MFSNYKFSAAERFVQYVQIDTQSDPQSNQNPSTVKQFNLSELLVKELLEMGANIEALIEGGHILGDATKASSTEISKETAAPVVESTSAISEGATING